MFASRIHDEVGPREKYGPNPMVSALTRPSTARTARFLKVDMIKCRCDGLGLNWVQLGVAALYWEEKHIRGLRNGSA